MELSALLIIDMLVDFISPSGALYVGENGRKIIPSINFYLEKARRERMPVIYLCDHHRPDDPEFTMFPPHCVEGTPGAEVIPELRPQRGELVIPKRRYSGFYGTDLDLSLRELEVKELILTGVCTNICILYTAADARMRNYKVIVPGDGVASFNEEAHQFALRELTQTLGVKVI